MEGEKELPEKEPPVAPEVDPDGPAEQRPSKVKIGGESLVRCPYCHVEVGLATEDWLACKACLARHHRDCWREGAGCSTCRGTEFLSSAAGWRRARILVLVATTLAIAFAAAATVLLQQRRAEEARERERAQGLTRADMEKLAEQARLDRERWAQQQKEAVRAREETMARQALEREKAKADVVARETARREADDKRRSVAEARLMLDRGKAELRQRRFATAARDFDASIAADPTRPEAWAFRGQAQLALDLPDKALADAEKALELAQGREASALGVRALVNEARGEHDAAVADARRAVELGPRYGESIFPDDLRVRLAEWLLARGDLDGALEHASKWTQETNGRLRARGLAVSAAVKLKQEKLREAESDLGWALREDPAADPALFALRAEVYVAQGDLPRAIVDLDDAFRRGGRKDAAVGARLEALRVKDRAGIPVIEPVALPRTMLPGKTVVTPQGQFLLDMSGTDRLLAIAADGSVAGEIQLQKGVADAELVRGKLLVACASSKVVLVVDLPTRKVVKAYELPSSPLQIVAGGPPGKIAVVLGERTASYAPVTKRLVEVDEETGAVRDLIGEEAGHFAFSGDAIVSQADRQPSGVVLRSLARAREKPYAPREPRDPKSTDLGGFFSFFRATMDGGFAATDMEGNALGFTMALAERWRRKDAQVLVAHPTKPVVVVARPRIPAARPNDPTVRFMRTREVLLSGLASDTGRELWQRIVVLPESSAFDLEAWGGGTRWMLPSLWGHVNEAASGDSLAVMIGASWFSIPLPAP